MPQPDHLTAELVRKLCVMATSNRHSNINQQGSDLHCEGFGDLLLRNLNLLKDDETLCDLTLIAESEAIHVHRVVMAACSDYFKALLTLDMKEKNQKTIQLKGQWNF